VALKVNYKQHPRFYSLCIREKIVFSDIVVDEVLESTNLLDFLLFANLQYAFSCLQKEVPHMQKQGRNCRMISRWQGIIVMAMLGQLLRTGLAYYHDTVHFKLAPLLVFGFWLVYFLTWIHPIWFELTFLWNSGFCKFSFGELWKVRKHQSKILSTFSATECHIEWKTIQAASNLQFFGSVLAKEGCMASKHWYIVISKWFLFFLYFVFRFIGRECCKISPWSHKTLI
jgi:hypothetical protein